MTPSLADRPLDEPPVRPAEAAYGAVVESARRELPESSFKLWFSDLAPGELKGDLFELIAPNGYVRRWQWRRRRPPRRTTRCSSTEAWALARRTCCSPWPITCGNSRPEHASGTSPPRAS